METYQFLIKTKQCNFHFYLLYLKVTAKVKLPIYFQFHRLVICIERFSTHCYTINQEKRKIKIKINLYRKVSEKMNGKSFQRQ